MALIDLFPDYSNVYSGSGFGWIIVGLIILIGSVGSVIPQIILIIKKRSSYGLSMFSTVLTNFGQFSIVTNVVALHSEQFAGLPHSGSIFIAIPRLLTFINNFFFCAIYMVIVFMLIVFSPKRYISVNEAPLSWAKIVSQYWLVIVYPIIAIIIFSLFCLVGTQHGFYDDSVHNIGKTMGTVSSLLVFIQYLPQMITTYKLKDSGSLSMTMLIIQAPGGIVNTLFLAIGQKENFTTWISFLLASIQQFILLGMCVFYNCQKSSQNSMTEELLSTSDIYT